MARIIVVSLVCLLAFTSVYSQAPTDPPCHTAAVDGIVEIGCWGYSECINGVFKSHVCPEKQVLDKLTRTCIPKGDGLSACNNETVCSLAVTDMMIADREDFCRSYYRCYGGVNVGQFYCPATTIFNEEYQTCDFPANVLVPCGTKPRPTDNGPIIITTASVPETTTTQKLDTVTSLTPATSSPTPKVVVGK